MIGTTVGVLTSGPNDTFCVVSLDLFFVLIQPKSVSAQDWNLLEVLINAAICLAATHEPDDTSHCYSLLFLEICVDS